jgi:hypothetical protein
MNTQIIELNDEYRLNITRDDYQYLPADILGEMSKATGFGVYFLPNRGFYGLEWYLNETYSDGTFIESLNGVFWAAYKNSNWVEPTWWPEIENALIKHMKRNNAAAEIVELRGYSQGEYASALIYSENWAGTSLEVIEQDLKSWFRGDVYTLTLEKAKVFTASDGETITNWDHVESVGGMVFSGDETDGEIVEMAEYYLAQMKEIA